MGRNAETRKTRKVPRNFSPRAVYSEATKINMKTLLSLLSTIVLIAGAISLDAYRLDAGDCVMAAMVAVLFGLALTDCGRSPRLQPRLR